MIWIFVNRNYFNFPREWRHNSKVFNIFFSNFRTCLSNMYLQDNKTNETYISCIIWKQNAIILRAFQEFDSHSWHLLATLATSSRSMSLAHPSARFFKKLYKTSGWFQILQQTANAFNGLGTDCIRTTSFINVSYRFLWKSLILTRSTYSSFWGKAVCSTLCDLLCTNPTRRECRTWALYLKMRWEHVVFLLPFLISCRCSCIDCRYFRLYKRFFYKDNPLNWRLSEIRCRKLLPKTRTLENSVIQIGDYMLLINLNFQLIFLFHFMITECIIWTNYKYKCN